MPFRHYDRTKKASEPETEYRKEGRKFDDTRPRHPSEANQGKRWISYLCKKDRSIIFGNEELLKIMTQIGIAILRPAGLKGGEGFAERFLQYGHERGVYLVRKEYQLEEALRQLRNG